MSKFLLDFKDFLDFAYQLEELGGTDALKKATENALNLSKEEANKNIDLALRNSPYSFEAGKKYSTGGVRKSFEEVSKRPVEWDGDVCRAYIGVDTAKELEILFAMYGTPHMAGDSNLKNAIKVKGKYRKPIDEIQLNEFNKVLDEVLKQ